MLDECVCVCTPGLAVTKEGPARRSVAFAMGGPKRGQRACVRVRAWVRGVPPISLHVDSHAAASHAAAQSPFDAATITP